MRLPGDAGAVSTDRNRPEAEDDVDTEPHRQKSEHARVAQRPGKRQRWNLRRGIRIAPMERKKTSPHEGEADGGGHRAGYRSRGADHRRDRMLMGDEMRQRARHGRHRHEYEEPDRTEPARQRAAKRQQPQHVEADMAE